MAIIAYLVVRLKTGEGLFGRKDSDTNITAVEEKLPDDTQSTDDADEQTGDAKEDETRQNKFASKSSAAHRPYIS